MKNLILTFLILIVITIIFLGCEGSKETQMGETVKIGNQVWMTKNLDVDHFRNGDSIIEAKTEKEQRAEVVKVNKQIANETAKRLLKDDSLKVPHSTSDLKEAFTQLNTFLKGKNPIDKLSSSDITEYSKYTKFFKEPNKHLTVRTSYKRLYDLTHEIAQQIRENDEKDKIARQKRAQQAKASGGAGGAGVASEF